MTIPVLTVAIPTFNRANWLPRCLCSVLACDRTDIEILIGDNASTDGTCALQQQYADPRLRWTTQSSNLGMAPNWQFLLDQARGRWFLLLSDDDMVESAALGHVIEKLTSITNDIVVTGLVIENHITHRETTLVPPGGIHVGRDFIIGSMAGEYTTMPSAMFLRTSALRTVGGYAPRPYRLVVDAAAWYEIAATGQVTVLPEIVSHYAVQPSSLTSSDNTMSHEVECLYKHWIGQLQPLPKQTAKIWQSVLRGATTTLCRRIAAAPWWWRPRLGLAALLENRDHSVTGWTRHVVSVGIASLGMMWFADAVRGRQRFLCRSCRH